jgi:hypothetical protein
MDGVISIPQLRPGSYLLFAVNNSHIDLWKCEDFVKNIASRGTDIAVGQRSQVVISINLIPESDIGLVQTQLGLVLPYK